MAAILLVFLFTGCSQVNEQEGSTAGVYEEPIKETEESVEETKEPTPEYRWNEPIKLEMPLETVEVGVYKDGSEYWIEFKCESMNTDEFLAFFSNSTSDWGFTTRTVANQLLRIIDMYDDAWEEGTMAYAVKEGYGIKWTAYLEMDKNVPATVGIKVNKLNEFTALFDGIINE